MDRCDRVAPVTRSAAERANLPETEGVVEKFILVSILLATIIVPMRAARDESPARGLRRTVLWMMTFNLMYLIALLYILPRL